MINIVHFSPKHLVEFAQRKEQADEPMPSAEMLTALGAMTVTNKDRPIAIIGLYPISLHVAQVWGFFSDLIRERPLSFHKAIMLLIDHKMDRHDLHRIQCSVKAGFNAGVKWANKLGFQCEGTMKKYGPKGEDYYLFARVRE